ncbi:uncharacterized protein TNCV_2714391 [Trichonephila clavipes]|nr:uncharacterized protein TNCV_2714391 [Trichonephila clavipes]
MMYKSCEPDEVHFSYIQPSDGFTDGYLRHHQIKKCFKRPCTFDAFTGQPLKKAHYEEEVGCVCDQAFGQFGVRIEGLPDYVRGPGERHPFTAKVRQFNFNETFYANYPPTFIRKPNQMEWCRFMSRHLKEIFLPSEWAFNLLYTFPACYIGKNDQEAPEQYRGRYVSNPLHFTYGAYAEHPRFNGLLLKHERGDWTLEFAPEYDIDIYRSIANPQMVPFLDDPVVNMLEQGYMSKDPIDEQNVLYRQQKQDRENNNEPTF